MDHGLTVPTLQGHNSYEEMRGAQRFTLLIRTAKLVCESGEFLCVIRDVSATGVRLKLFHDLPADRHLALELANGEVYFVECVWERDGHAGFRFSAPIEVHCFIEEVSPYPRRQIRLRMHLPAVVSADGQEAVATVRDLSQQGARIACSRRLAIGQRVKLEADGLPPILARICWRSEAEFGLAFEQVFALDELARLANALQMQGPGSTDRAVSYG